MTAEGTRARAAVILAAGAGTRMKSPTPKVLHTVGGRTLLDHAIDTAQALGCERIVVVCNPALPTVAARVEARLGKAAVAWQETPQGTGHAVLAAREALAGFTGDAVITFADGILPPRDVAPLFALRDSGVDVGVLGFMAADPTGYGRLIINASGDLIAIVEEREADETQRALKSCNSGILAADAGLLMDLLGEVKNENAKGEYYLTDAAGIAHVRGLKVRVAYAPEASFKGVNSQAQLAEAEGAWQAAKRLELMDGGVSMPAPHTVHLSWDTEVAAGAVIEPNVVFAPGVKVEAGAVIRAFSHLEGCVVRAGALVGPYARLRPGADIGEDAHIGNFVEVKKVKVGKGAKANHLAYLGDGSVGAGANIGAGTIFCNYDGFDKYDTHVGEGAFIGSNSALVAPVTVGPGAYTGSGSVITKDVAADALGVARGRQAEIPGWAAAFRAKKRKAKGLE